MSKAHHNVSKSAWIAARKELMLAEKAFMKQGDALAEKRRALPRMRVETPYTFDSGAGEVTLEELFSGRSQLVIYHFMFDPSWEKGCKSCSFWADHFDAMIPHLAARDVSFAVVSSAAPDKLAGFAERMGWRFRWLSTHRSSFNRDFGATFTEEEVAGGEALYNFGTQKPNMAERNGASVFVRDDEGGIHLTYATFARGTEVMNLTYRVLDLVPNGRGEQELDYSMSWVRLHDEYGT